MGTAIGTGLAVIPFTQVAVCDLTGDAVPVWICTVPWDVVRADAVVAGVAQSVAVYASTFNLFALIYLLSVLLGREWAAILFALSAIVAVYAIKDGVLTPAAILFLVARMAIYAATAWHFGLLAGALCSVVAHLMHSTTLTTDTASWYTGSGAVYAAVVVVLAGYGAWAATGGREWVRELVRGDD
ncbi:MAG: hypothetical protein K2X87_33340 [Gemmataceae bacterium]|nr:hypothetical protein [Gemmataceae bacterium]